MLEERVKKIPVLTKKEEQELFSRLASGDDRAMEKILKHNIRLVISIASKLYAGVGSLELDDLISEGVIGLKTAALKFDHEKGYKFSTYATWWIKQAIIRAVQNKNRLIRLPCHIEEKITKRRKQTSSAIDVDGTENKKLEILNPLLTHACSDALGYPIPFVCSEEGSSVNDLVGIENLIDKQFEKIDSDINRKLIVSTISGIKDLSPADKKSFYYTVAGESTKGIARRLKISPNRVRTAVNRVVVAARKRLVCQEF